MGLLDSVKRAASATPERITGRTRAGSTAGPSPGASSSVNPGSKDEQHQVESAEGDDVSVLDEREGNVIMAMVSQLRIGMDLNKIALPTFVLEPRSMLERITDFFSHPDLIFGADQMEDPKDRFLAVLRYYMSGWHIKPKGRVPYNATLGEIFRCSYKYPDGSKGFYVAEQVSHHPPVSAYFYISPQNGVLIYGELRPKSKFLGNSAATIMDGENRVILMNKPEDGEYQISMPNMYARGILFGKLILELGDTSSINNVNTGIHCDVEFKTKGFFSGTYNAVTGKVANSKGTLGEINGLWSESMEYKDSKTGRTQTLFDAQKATSTPKTVAPEPEQEPNESQRLWKELTDAIKRHDMEGATEAKTAVEDRQRERARERGSEADFPLRFFEARGEKYVPLCGVTNLPKDPVECTNFIQNWIWSDSTSSSGLGHSPSAPSMNGKIHKQESPAKVAAAARRQSVGSGSLHVVEAVPTIPGPPRGPVQDHPPGAY
ncbi:Oxysterol-binding protein [Phaffia rhodozyma]|uniref:Oxysterol-binding protein n=1 Tax=Phaffia rhodozyma TaxID=264483 RepID=A0A0F7SHK6_PHARH|nr:Oxysterol-binding protein [Phaffia rhodozyma]